jgi:hypothetical protein
MLRRPQAPVNQSESESHSQNARTRTLYWLGYPVIALCILSVLSSIANGRPAAAAVGILCLYVSWTAWQHNAESLRHIELSVVDEASPPDSDG